MYLDIKNPTEKISDDAVTVWRISNIIGHSIVMLVISALYICAKIFHWYDWIVIVLLVLGGITILSAIYEIGFQPTFLQRTWRYEIDEQFVQLKHGRCNVSHTIIPMEKVEYVRTEQGPILRRYRLYSIEIGTTATSHTIPAIPEQKAIELKAQIAVYAKLTDQAVLEGEHVV
ncbi:PH domain-containing protein [Bacillus rubiinfantis]|uniref:PH domain-containing protein n=1 Tax=Bacillus rubiinfantis TaxID=1499680 RepID=UPI0005AAF9E8|nr:PH domain-containing protein [Bacillus rubiinfantis]